VHVTQAHFLGLDQFTDRYVRELTAEASKDVPDWMSIPLERTADNIQDQYLAGALPPGDVTPRILAELSQSVTA